MSDTKLFIRKKVRTEQKHFLSGLSKIPLIESMSLQEKLNEAETNLLECFLISD